MSITNYPDADFTPDIPNSGANTGKQSYNPTGSFRFWAQKVLPTVYDDSLSYYEILTKVVNYLNAVIQNVDSLNESVDNTNSAFDTLQKYVNGTKDTIVSAYNELQDYVNTYFDSLDVQEEINAKLDNMASDGSLSNVVSPFIPSLVADWLSDNITPTSPAIDASLSISGAGADAKVTGELIGDLKSDLNSLELLSYQISYGIALADNKWSPTATGVYNHLIPVNSGDTVYIKANSTKACYYAFLKSLNGMEASAVADFATGYDSVEGVAVNSETSISTPIDANYLFVLTADTNVIPSSVEINGYKPFESARDNITSLVEKTGEAVRTQINDLRSDLNNLGLLSYQIRYGISLVDNKWSPTATGVYNRLIPINSGDTVYIKANSTKACYYAFLKSLNGMEASAVADFATGYDSVEGVAVNSETSISTPIDANYLFVLTADTNFIPSVLEINGYNTFESARDNITDLVEKAKYLTNNSIINAYEPTNLTEGSVINYTDGAEVSNQYTTGYAITDYIPVKYGDIIHLAYLRGTDLCGGALYDANRNYIKTIWGTEDFSRPSTNISSDFEFIIDSRNIAYLRYNVQLNTIFPRSKQYIWITPSKVFKSLHRTFVVGNGKDFETLKSCLDYINNSDIIGATVYVEPGTYNLVEEFGQEYLDNIQQTTNRSIGLSLGNDTHLVFAEGALVKFLYNGNNPAVCEYFSPFNITGSFVLENANIEVSNARYCVHEDLPASASIIPISYTAVYKNCVMKHNGNTSGTYTGTVCIGGGCMKNSLSIIDGGKYTCGTQYPRAISYHNYNTADHGNHPSRVILKNVWINNALRLGTFSTSVVDVEISGCYIPNGIYDGNATYFNVTQWNNIGIN